MGRPFRRSVFVALSVVAVSAVLLAPGCSKAPDPWKKAEGGDLKVLVSFPPLYCFAKAVAGDDAKVLSVVTTSGPHGFQMTSNHAMMARHADVFFYNGLELDDWVKDIVDRSGNSKLLDGSNERLIAVADVAIPTKLRIKFGEGIHRHDHGDEKAHKHEHKHDHGHGHGHHHHGEWDPHVWLSPRHAIKMVEQIRDTLVRIDPKHKEGYEKRAAAYIERLRKEVLEYGKEKLKDVELPFIVTTHDSLAYFANDDWGFGFEIIGTILSHEGAEPEGRRLAELVEECDAHGVRVIAHEPQYNQRAAKTVQKALGEKGIKAKLVEIDPIETAEVGIGPDHYITVMRANIDNLAKNLE